MLAVLLCLVYLTDRDGTQAACVGGWGPTGEPGSGRWGITLVADRLGADAVVSGDRAAGGGVLRHRPGHPDGDERQPVSIFPPTYLVLSAGCVL